MTGERSAFQAQVVLRPRAGAAAPPATAATLGAALPDPAMVRVAREFFERHGFGVGPSGAAGFTVQAPLGAFARTFGMTPDALAGLSAGGGELDLSSLPEDLRAAVRAVVVTAPPAFGPGNP